MESPPDQIHPKFELGAAVATPGALELLQRAGKQPLDYIIQHLQGQWGDLDEHDRLINEQALLHGGRLLSSYRIVGEERIWIITEQDRSASTILLPSDYW
jgi:hypothetical protein